MGRKGNNSKRNAEPKKLQQKDPARSQCVEVEGERRDVLFTGASLGATTARPPCNPLLSHLFPGLTPTNRIKSPEYKDIPRIHYAVDCSRSFQYRFHFRCHFAVVKPFYRTDWPVKKFKSSLGPKQKHRSPTHIHLKVIHMMNHNFFQSCAQRQKNARKDASYPLVNQSFQINPQMIANGDIKHSFVADFISNHRSRTVEIRRSYVIAMLGLSERHPSLGSSLLSRRRE